MAALVLPNRVLGAPKRLRCLRDGLLERVHEADAGWLPRTATMASSAPAIEVGRCHESSLLEWMLLHNTPKFGQEIQHANTMLLCHCAVGADLRQKGETSCLPAARFAQLRMCTAEPEQVHPEPVLDKAACRCRKLPWLWHTLSAERASSS